jgi:hypothetical protein
VKYQVQAKRDKINYNIYNYLEIIMRIETDFIDRDISMRFSDSLMDFSDAKREVFSEIPYETFRDVTEMRNDFLEEINNELKNARSYI